MSKGEHSGEQQTGESAAGSHQVKSLEQDFQDLYHQMAAEMDAHAARDRERGIDALAVRAEDQAAEWRAKADQVKESLPRQRGGEAKSDSS